jgi:thiamine biosynthesis protein ThiS
MRISLKVAGTIGRYLPAGSSGNTAQLDMAEGATPLQVMERLGMPPEGGYLVILNNTVVPKAERAERKLSDGDRLAIVPPLKGG